MTGEAKKTVGLTLNGKPVEATADPQTPLLHVLREVWGARTARFGCGTGLCGACMVIIDGKAHPSCDIPLEVAEGRSVETVEGLAAADPPHPLMAAIVKRQAAQCGYCLPGIVMSAKALLATTPAPSREEIAAGLDGNLCRCGTHVRILDAIEDAAAALREAAR